MRVFFGKGLYGSIEPEYAYKVYCKGGTLLLNWISLFSAYPVVGGDESMLRGKANYQNYDAHFAPVKPQSSNTEEANYIACAPQHAKYHEVVVFDAGSCFPRFMVELQPESLPFSLPPRIEPTPLPEVSKKMHTEGPIEIQKDLEKQQRPLSPPKPNVPPAQTTAQHNPLPFSDCVLQYISTNPGHTPPQIRQALHQRKLQFSKKDLNSTLDGLEKNRICYFIQQDGYKLWYLSK